MPHKDPLQFEIKLSDAKSVDSEIRGNCVIDFDEKGSVVRIAVFSLPLEEMMVRAKVPA